MQAVFTGDHISQNALNEAIDLPRLCVCMWNQLHEKDSSLNGILYCVVCTLSESLTYCYRFRRAPFVMMDEFDASLDVVNVAKVL